MKLHRTYGQIPMLQGHDNTVIRLSGYLQACGQSCVSKLLGLEWQDPLGESPYQETDRWKQVLAAAKTIWQV